MGNENALRHLRAQVVNEHASLAGLLRMCLMLGAETGSAELRTWASRELNGYDNDADLPPYRQIVGVLCIDTLSGPHHVTGQQISPVQLPEFARDEVSNDIDMLQPIEELERLATTTEDAVLLSKSGFPELAVLWSHQLGPHQQVLRVY